MRLVLQRVSKAEVFVMDELVGSCGEGYMILVGIGHSDTPEIVRAMWEKTKHLRVFEDDNHKMNKSLLDIQGSVLAVSQFTLYANCRHGRRPSFTDAAKPEHARALYDYFCVCVKDDHIPLGRGIFGADMQVHLVNSGPVTIVLDSDEVLASTS